MREQGEGIPRMHEVMARAGLEPPEFAMVADEIFVVTLKNAPVYSVATETWLKQFDTLRLSLNQRRLLAYAREHDDLFTSRAYRALVGIDLYAASRDIKELIRKGVARLET
jgi:predicted HTH transcriptional regulator